MLDPDPYPAYSRPELVADGVLHALGIAASIGAVVLLPVLGADALDLPEAVAFAIYATALIFAFVASAAYHMTPWEAARPLFRRIDHAAIYLKIAATYTPLVAMIGSVFGYVVLAAVWLLALFGATRKLFFWTTPGSRSSLIFLGLGWTSVLLMWSIFTTLPPLSGGLIVLGGLVYTAGAWIHAHDDLGYVNAIWHGFVLTGSACFFAAIAIGIVAL